MNENNIQLLNDIENVLVVQKDKLQTLFNQNQFRIEKINSYLDEIAEKEDEDFKVFSPRSTENIYRERKIKDITEKENCEKENEKYWNEIKILNELIEKIQLVTENIRNEDENKTKKDFAGNFARNTQNNVSIEKNDYNLEESHIGHQILNCVSYIPADCMRAKIELTKIAKKLLEKMPDIDIK